MKNPGQFEFEDLQGLLRFSHGKLTDTCFMLLNIIDPQAAKQWLQTAPISNASATNSPPDTALQIAFSVKGLRVLGLKPSVIDGFSDEFIAGMSGDENRSRRLGDVADNAPEHWQWGGDAEQVPDVLLLLYARKEGLEAWRNRIETAEFMQAFKLQILLPTLDIGAIEPFGFADGVSQPNIDWSREQSTDLHERDCYSNFLAVGEMVLGYQNEYGEYTHRPLIDPRQDQDASELPNAEDNPLMKDLGRNGSYLVIRQLQQDVPGFWQFLDQIAGSVPEQRERLAEAMVGRKRNGAPLVVASDENIAGIAPTNQNNHFDYRFDPKGQQCPLGAHIRRANPRTGDFPAPITGILNRLIKILGFGTSRPDEDLIASTRFHRLQRRGRSYGPLLKPEDAVKPDAPVADRGLQFVCLVANISRQFEFVQNAWSMSSKFGGVQQESDPLSGHRQSLLSGESTAHFNHPDINGPMRKVCDLPQFIRVRGGGYFFMPGLRAMRYIATLPGSESDK